MAAAMAEAPFVPTVDLAPLNDAFNMCFTTSTWFGYGYERRTIVLELLLGNYFHKKLAVLIAVPGKNPEDAFSWSLSNTPG